jgi:hypothetical protein
MEVQFLVGKISCSSNVFVCPILNDILKCQATIQVVCKWFLFFINQSYFKLHLQNAYQLKDQLKRFYEQ